MSSEGPTHNEFDFEFLGNTTGEPYSVHTNVYVNEVGNREQRLNLWFDPTKDFHDYSIFWNQRQVVCAIIVGLDLAEDLLVEVGADKAKVAVVVGALKVKSGTTAGIKWIKNQYLKRTPSK
ncbi:Glycoside hydrolase family 16 [Sesbania bispinosa]|nr:Glycoside hydrolase family 16 [Sesbania bispinosa]